MAVISKGFKVERTSYGSNCDKISQASLLVLLTGWCKGFFACLYHLKTIYHWVSIHHGVYFIQFFFESKLLGILKDSASIFAFQLNERDDVEL